MSRIRRVHVWCLLSGLLGACGEDLNAPGSGSIEVTSVTTGDLVDPDGYSLSLDGVARAIQPNATITLSDLSPGNHDVELGGVAPNCTLTGQNPRTVEVASGTVTRLTLEVTCAAPNGIINVTTSTTGESLDPDGYVVVLDGGTPRAIGLDETITFGGVTAGDHVVSLGTVAPNCTVTGKNPRDVTVSSEAIEVGFEITCGPASGTLVISASTGGLNRDADGYSASVDGGAGQPIGTNANLTVTALPVGSHTVELSGIAPNCSVAGENPQRATVINGGATAVAFQVECLPTGSGTLLFESDRGGTARLYRMRQDGSQIVNLTPSSGSYGGDWSPDGSRIVFTSFRNQEDGIYLMNADGSDPTWLGVAGGGPKWSPDGRRILFVSGVRFATDGTIYVMNADGSDVNALTTGRSPDWSPDGERIAFGRIAACVVDICSSDLYVMAKDGTQVRKLLGNSGLADNLSSPAWSPDGRQIAFGRSCCFFGPSLSGVWRISPGGGAPTRIDARPVAGGPVWSPDGSAIAFAAELTNSTTDLTVIPSGGGGGIVLAKSSGSEYPTSWK
ncbi:MAG TPA: hypothetical protein VIA81_02855 [Acidimicrobiia bacterium]